MINVLSPIIKDSILYNVEKEEIIKIWLISNFEPILQKYKKKPTVLSCVSVNKKRQITNLLVSVNLDLSYI